MASFFKMKLKRRKDEYLLQWTGEEEDNLKRIAKNFVPVNCKKFKNNSKKFQKIQKSSNKFKSKNALRQWVQATLGTGQ
jgi:hypothetical protein